ncbi:MAG: oligosaccharyl transferase, archaeosortase A system-associated [Dehalococcoidales bacterium]|nr:oligosaccharyl transferase, archaeosortase A system-associated [Dehalococcoidales bacterium]
MNNWLSRRGKAFYGCAIVVMVLLCFALALFLRIALPYDQVFKGDLVKFTEVDAYSHMRLVDNLLQHFPNRTAFDPYTYFPEGAPVYYPPLFTLFLGGTIWLFSLGAPTAHSINVIGAFFPAILGSLTVIPVFFIGKTLFNRWAGLIGAFLVAILPGDFLGRTMLGFTDHHVVEILFTTATMMFLILALKNNQSSDAIQSGKPDWKVSKKVVLSSLLAGLFLGLYLQMWAGGPLFIFLLFIYFVVQFINNHLRHRPTGHLFVIGSLVFITASIITLPFLPEHYSPSLYTISLITASLTPSILFFLSKAVSIRLKPIYYALGIISVGVIGITAFYIIEPGLLKSLLANFGILAPSNLDLTIGEVQPLLFPDGTFTLSLAWSDFTTTFFVSLVALGFLIYQVFKHGEEDKTLLAVWSLVILVMTLGQRRFAYYMAINVAVLTAYALWRMMAYLGVKERFSEPVKEQRGLTFRTTAGPLKSTFIAIAVFLAVFLPNIKPAIVTASQLSFAPEDAWCESLNWLRENSPDPFADPNVYYAMCQPPTSGPDYDYPESAYGVMAWWDYGHWITRIAHRLPNHAPGGGRSALVADCFLAQNEAEANKLVNELDSRYIMVDYTTALYKFHGVATFAGSTRENFFEICYQNKNGVMTPVTLFYPEYYRSFLVRLYMFDGKAVTPDKCTVVSLQEKTAGDGQVYKEVTDVRVFDNYQDAEAYRASQRTDDYRIVSTSPFVSPVPLETLQNYRLIYTSVNSTAHPGTKNTTPVKIFINMGNKNGSAQEVKEVIQKDNGS